MTRHPYTSIVLGSVCCISQLAWADDIQDELAALKQRIEALEQRKSENTPLGIQWSGALELEAGYLKDYNNDSNSDLRVETAFLAAQKQIQSNLLAAVTVLYEEDETPLEVDEAYISYGINDHFAVTGGQIYVPFGQYNTAVVSDPLTLEIGETRTTAAMVSYAKDDYQLDAYVFRGDSNTDGQAIDNFGGRLRKNFSYQDGAGFFSLDFISNLLSSDRLSDVTPDFDDSTAGMATALHWDNRVWGAAFEYVSALVNAESETPGLFDSQKPAALQLECFYNDTVYHQNITFAASYQQTKDALLLNLPERRWVVSAALPLTTNLAVSAQLYADRDYGEKKEVAGISGTGDDAKGVLLQLAVEI